MQETNLCTASVQLTEKATRKPMQLLNLIIHTRVIYTKF